MTKIKNWFKLIGLLITSFIAIIILLESPIINIEKLINNCDDFYYNCITLSSVIGGFLFTGISILISVIDKERIQRLWKNNYLDNLYRSAFTGIILNIITIIVSIVLLCFNIEAYVGYLVKLEMASLIEGIIFFSWCVSQLMFVISRLKKR